MARALHFFLFLILTVDPLSHMHIAHMRENVPEEPSPLLKDENHEVCMPGYNPKHGYVTTRFEEM